MSSGNGKQDKEKAKEHYEEQVKNLEKDNKGKDDKSKGN